MIPTAGLDPRLAASIDLQGWQDPHTRACGCRVATHGNRIWLCQYHEGFADGLDAHEAPIIGPDPS